MQRCWAHNLLDSGMQRLNGNGGLSMFLRLAPYINIFKHACNQLNQLLHFHWLRPNSNSLKPKERISFLWSSFSFLFQAGRKTLANNKAIPVEIEMKTSQNEQRATLRCWTQMHQFACYLRGMHLRGAAESCSLHRRTIDFRSSVLIGPCLLLLWLSGAI